MKKLILITALFAACTKTVPLEQKVLTPKTSYSEAPSQSDTVFVGFKIKETQSSATRSRMTLFVYLREGSVDVDVDVTVRWRLGDHSFLKTVTIPTGKTSINLDIEGEYLAPLSIEGDYITSVTPKQASKYTFKF